MSLFTLARLLLTGEHDFIAKHNSNYGLLEDAIRRIIAAIPKIPNANIGYLYRALFGTGAAVIDENSCQASIVDDTKVQLTGGDDYAWLPVIGSVLFPPTTQTVELAGLPDDTYYISLNAIGQPVASLSTTDALYSVLMDGGVLDPMSLTRMAATCFNLKVPLEAPHGGTGITTAADGKMMQAENVGGELTWSLVDPADFGALPDPGAEGYVLTVVSGEAAWAERGYYTGKAADTEVVVTNAEQDLDVASYLVTTNLTAGRTVRIRTAGTWAALPEASRTITWHLYIQGVEILSISHDTYGNAGRWWIEADVVVRSVASTTVHLRGAATLITDETGGDDTEVVLVTSDKDISNETNGQVKFTVDVAGAGLSGSSVVTQRTQTIELLRG